MPRVLQTNSRWWFLGFVLFVSIHFLIYPIFPLLSCIMFSITFWYWGDYPVGFCMLAIVREYFTCINRQGSLSTIHSEEESSGRIELMEAILSEFPFIDFSFFLACIFGLIREAQFELCLLVHTHFFCKFSNFTWTGFYVLLCLRKKERKKKNG